MKSKRLLAILFAGLLMVPVVVSADVASTNLSGNLVNYEDVAWFSVGQSTTTFQIQTNSHIGGSFDPILSIWDLSGNRLAFNNDINFSIGIFDSRIDGSFPFGDGTLDFYVALSVFANFPTPSGGVFTHDGSPLTPLPSGKTFYNILFFDSNSAQLIQGNPFNSVPEPSTLLLLGSGLVGLVGFGRKKVRK